MNYPFMEEATRYYKETQEGVEYMCKAFEEVRNEGFNRGMQQKEFSSIKVLMETMNLSSQQAMDALMIPPAEQAKYAAML